MLTYSDTEEEAARGGRRLATPHHRTLPTRRSSNAVTLTTYEPTGLYDALGDLEHRLTQFDVPVPDVVQLRMGAHCFAVRSALLQKDPQSLLHVMVMRHFARTQAGEFRAADSEEDDDGLSGPGAVAGHRSPRGGLNRRRTGVKSPQCGLRGQRAGSSAAAGGVASRPPLAALQLPHAETEQVVQLPDRDPVLLGMLLNMLRGYRHCIPDGYKEACREEAAFYGLTSSWEQRFPPTTAGAFVVLPGKASCAAQQLSTEVVCALASDFLSSGTHTMWFEVERCEAAAFGVVCTAARDGWLDELNRFKGCAMYWSDGSLTSNFPGGAVLKEDTGAPFASRCRLSVQIDFEAKWLRWALQGGVTVGMLRFPDSIRELAFGVSAMRDSRITICRSTEP